MVDRALSIAGDDSHGYSQKGPSGRWGPDYDCSSLMYEIADYAGYDVGRGYSDGKVRFTGTMLKDFKDAGFQILPFANVGLGELEIGDILLNLALHAEIYVGEGQSVGANASENGGYFGESGDQTGQEISKHPVYTFDKGWDYILRAPAEDEEAAEPDEEEAEDQGGQEMPYPYNNSNYGNYNQQPWTPARSYGMNGYPQGNLGQMNGYSQANAGFPASNTYGQQGYYGNQQQTMPSGPQGYSGGQQQLIRVNGMEGARDYQLAPNSCVALFDGNENIMYIKSTDQQGFPNIRAFHFEEFSEGMDQHGGSAPMDMGSQQFVTRREFDELKEMIEGGKQLISSDQQQQQSGSSAKSGRNS